MGKKKVMSSTTPVFPFPGAVEPPYHHFSDYGFDPHLHFFQAIDGAKRPATTRRPPLDSARFRLQKPISKNYKNTKKQHHGHLRGRRRWWSAAASAALLFFKRSCNPTNASAPSPSSYSNAAAWPLYLADADAGGGGGEDASCTCWAPTFRSGHLATAELGAASAMVPYVSLREVSLVGGGSGGAPAMPIYLVT